ncbi:putative symporter YidK [Thalassoglobus neptunius]|uniref:Putative symporter YidK n=1 Tax=Thalassoglobus neptunius TaxID=1938619 RepID=A0A5C5X428_9PLAN|nr:solute:sodium symporter family transporter [Thalassoglobus neptunius]TWT57736.1 putative symporter YidK [Thalassoglobus neptunius]
MLTLLSFVFFTALVGFITWRLTRHDNHDSSAGYFLAGRSLTGGFIAGSLLLTNLSTEQLVGLNGDAYRDGICVMAWEVVAAVSLVILALFYLPRYLKSGIATVPQFLENRFDHGTRNITTLIFLVAYAGILLPIILFTGARGVSGMLQLGELTGIQDEFTLIALTVWLIGTIGSIYAIWGGLRTVAVSDTLNGFGLLVGGLLIAYFGLTAVNPEGPVAGLQTLREAAPEKFNSIGGPDQSVPFFTLFSGVLLLNLFYWTTNQQIIQRTFGAKNLAEGQKGVLLAGSLKVLAPMILVLPGLVAFHQYGRVETEDGAYAVKDKTTDAPAVVVSSEAGKEILHGSEARELLKVTTDADVLAFAEQTVHDSVGKELAIEKVLPVGVVIVEDENGEHVYLDELPEEQLDRVIPPRNADKSYGRLVQDVLPDYLVGFFAAAVIGAILSSFNSALNSTATLFSLGVYQGMLRPNASETEVIRSGKIFGTVIAVVTMLVAPMLLGQDSIFGYLQKMNGLYFIPIFSVMLVGMLSKRVPALAAKVTLIASFFAICLGYFTTPGDAFVSSIHTFHFLGLVFAGSVALMLVIGAVKPRETPWEQQYSGDVDLTPWPLAKPMGIGLMLFVAFIYAYFADFSIITGN